MKKNEIKINSTRRDALHAAFRSWSEGATGLDEIRDGTEPGHAWKIHAHGGTMATADALDFSLKIQATATIGNELNEAGVVIDWTQPHGDKADFTAATLNIIAILAKYKERFWSDMARDIIDILTA